jgi:transcriptional regulator with XRE-family HTH domain
MASSHAFESFRDLLLRHRGRTGLTQRELADRIGVNRRSVQEWENGSNYPGADRLEALIRALVVSGGLSAGHKAEEAQALWPAVQRDSPGTHAPFDQAWFAKLLAQRDTPAAAAAGRAEAVNPAMPRVPLSQAPWSAARTGARRPTQPASWAAPTSC